jgi:hypothetical protein
MQSLLEFLQLRSISTFRWIRWLWFAYLLMRAWSIFGDITNPPRMIPEVTNFEFWVIHGSIVFNELMSVVIMRLLIEVAIGLLNRYWTPLPRFDGPRSPF